MNARSQTVAPASVTADTLAELPGTEARESLELARSLRALAALMLSEAPTENVPSDVFLAIATGVERAVVATEKAVHVAQHYLRRVQVGPACAVSTHGQTASRLT